MEFAIMAFFALAFLLAAAFIYSQEGTEVVEIRVESQMRSICTSLSARVAGLAAAGPGSSVRLDYPEALYGNNYSIWVNSGEGTISIVNEWPGGELSTVGCLLKTRAVTGGGAQPFQVAPNGSARNAEGVVVFGT